MTEDQDHNDQTAGPPVDGAEPQRRKGPRPRPRARPYPSPPRLPRRPRDLCPSRLTLSLWTFRRPSPHRRASSPRARHRRAPTHWAPWRATRYWARRRKVPMDLTTPTRAPPLARTPRAQERRAAAPPSLRNGLLAGTAAVAILAAGVGIGHAAWTNGNNTQAFAPSSGSTRIPSGSGSGSGAGRVRLGQSLRQRLSVRGRIRQLG